MIVRQALAICDRCGLTAELIEDEVPPEWSVTQDTVGNTRDTHHFCCRQCRLEYEGKEPSYRSLDEMHLRILRLVAQGYSNKDLCAEMNLAESTVKNRLNAIYRAVGVQGRVQAVLAGHVLGLINLPRLASDFYHHRNSKRTFRSARRRASGLPKTSGRDQR